MKQAFALAVCCAAIMASAPPAAASEELLFRYRPVHTDGLKRFDRQPYWRVLSMCAGMHGGMANRYQAHGDTATGEAAKARGLAFMNKAVQQLRADRGLSGAAAIDLATPDVNAGREIGLIPSKRNALRSREQMIDLFCSQADGSHQAASRNARR